MPFYLVGRGKQKSVVSPSNEKHGCKSASKHAVMPGTITSMRAQVIHLLFTINFTNPVKPSNVFAER